MASSRNQGIAIFLSVFFPFVGLIYTLAHWREWWAKNAFWLVCIYMGAVMIYCPEGSVLGMGGDGGRYVIRLISMHDNPSLSIKSILDSYLRDSQVMDLYQPLTTFFVSRFTDNGHVLFAFFAFVFGFFYSRNIWYVLDRLPEGRLGKYSILVALFFLICPITQINGVRMWTALHMYVYGMMPYLLERDKSKFLWVIFTPLVHFSFLYVAVFALIWVILPYIFKNNNVVLAVALGFFLVTLFVNTVNVNAVSGMIEEYSPDSYEEKLSGYFSEDYIANRTDADAAKNWYVGLSGTITHWSYNILLLLLLPILRRRDNSESSLMQLYVFTLFLGGIANIMALLPSGGRFQLLSQMFKVPLILMASLSLPVSNSFKSIVSVFLILLLLPLVFNIRQVFDYFSITVLLGNFITVFFWENNVPLIGIVKRLL